MADFDEIGELIQNLKTLTETADKNAADGLAVTNEILARLSFVAYVLRQQLAIGFLNCEDPVSASKEFGERITNKIRFYTSAPSNDDDRGMDIQEREITFAESFFEALEKQIQDSLNR